MSKALSDPGLLLCLDYRFKDLFEILCFLYFIFTFYFPSMLWDITDFKCLIFDPYR